jgi:hypothetical protein
MLIPKMGTHSVDARRADALFSSVQQRVLALLLGHPERSFQGAEVIRLAKGGTGAVHRELCRLAEAGWLTVTPIGNQKHYRANRACPGFRELHALVVETLGAPRIGGRAEKSPPRPLPPRAPDEREENAPPAPTATPDEGWKAW